MSHLFQTTKEWVSCTDLTQNDSLGDIPHCNTRKALWAILNCDDCISRYYSNSQSKIMTTTGIQKSIVGYSCIDSYLPCLLVSAFDNVTDNHVVKLFLVEMLHDCTIKQIILIQSTATRSTFFISEIHDFYESTANRLKGSGYAYFSNEDVITSKESMLVSLLALLETAQRGRGRRRQRHYDHVMLSQHFYQIHLDPEAISLVLTGART